MTAQVWVAGHLFAANVTPTAAATVLRAADQFGIPSITFLPPESRV